MPTFDEITAFVTDKPVVTAVIALLSLAGLALAVLVLRIVWRALAKLVAKLAELFKTYVTPRPTEDVLTVVAAAIATSVSAQGMWQFFDRVLGPTEKGPGVPLALRVLLFAFIEVAVVTSAVRARRKMRETGSAGVDGLAVWVFTCLSAVLSTLEAQSFEEHVFRLAAPLVAAWLWERGMAIERHRIRGTGRINWRITPERVLVRLGLAEARDRTAAEVDAHRRLTRVALAAKKAKALRERGASERKLRAAFAKLDKAMDQAVEHTGLSNDEKRQAALLAQIDSLNSTGVLAQRETVARWADPVTSEQRANALAAIEEAQRFDTAEATQRALDKAALTLMALTESVTSAVTSQRVNGEVNNKVNGHTVPAPREVEKLTLPVTSHVTPELTVERVNPALNFDITNPAAYTLESALASTPYVSPALSGQLTATALNIEVNDDPEDATKTQVMRDFWDREVAEDRYPSPKDLADHAGVHPSHASRKRKEWVAELVWWKRRKADPKRASKAAEPVTSTPSGDPS